MMMLLKLILIYFIVINIYIFQKKKQEFMGFDNWGEFLKSLVILTGFLIFFVVFVRVLNLFRESKILDLKVFLYNFDISFLILSLVCLLLVRKNIMFVVKLNFLKIHYFGSVSFIPQNPFFKIYRNFYYKYVFTLSSVFYNKTYWLDKILSIIMLYLVMRDLVLNNMVLDQCLCFAPWYSVYKLCFVCSRFVAIKQNSFLDDYLCRVWYQREGYYSDFDVNSNLQEIYIRIDKYEKEVIKV